ncbi:MAG: NUDIX hydrolase [Betaproteobacteria bacterium]|jgi:ADP-ribose pyrophosphatase|nr:NUDIX hydrolase [Betaproteobacteria bacterium]
MVLVADPRPAPQANEAAPQLSECRVSGEFLLDGRLLKVYRDAARAADGSDCVREYTLHPGAAAMVPCFDDGSLLLERQWRYPLNRSFLEFPAGKLDPGETPIQTAVRELQEETGYTAGEWAVLGPMHPVISYSTEVIHLFLARGLREGSANRESGECLELVRMPIEAFFLAIERGEVTDAKTLACAFWLSRIQTGHYEPKWFKPSAS